MSRPALADGAARLAVLPRCCQSRGSALPRQAFSSAQHLPVHKTTRRWQSATASSAGAQSSSCDSAPGASTSKPTSPLNGPVALYEQRVKEGLLRPDDYQRSVAKLMQRLYDDLLCYRPPDVPEPAERPGGIFGRLIKAEPTIPPIPDDLPNGLYLFGDVGCGKTMLMDILYDSLPDALADSKRRIHFHAFMVDVHKRGHRLKTEGFHGSDSIVPIARELAREGRILCFDEFQVTDIVDAMILKRLLEALLAYGTVIMMTSNRKPDDLYKNGIQRKSFVPCIELIKQRFVVEDLNSGVDYRKIPRALSRVYYDPITDSHRSEFDKLFAAQTDSDGGLESGRQLEVWGRRLKVPASSKHVARFTFAELCGHALSAADYIAITQAFETIFVADVPQLSFNERDMARRFILFIDACYESRTKLFALSEVPITKIFSDKPAESDEMSAHMRSTMDDLGLSASEVGASSIFSGEEEFFAFARAVSRLTEMGTKAWSTTSKGLTM